MDTNDKVKMNVIDYIDNVKVHLNETYGVQSLTKGEK